MAEVTSSAAEPSIEVPPSSTPSSAPLFIDRRLLTIAQKLHARYLQRIQRPVCTILRDLNSAVNNQLADALKDARLLQAACDRGWLTAAKEQRDNLRYSLRHLLAGLEPLRPAENESVPRIPTLRDVYLELRAAEEDFGAIEHTDDGDGDGPRISVTTDPIRLEGRNLGRFRIDLILDDFKETSPLEWFRVEALDPDTAANDNDVPHPHVSQSRLCTGDAQHPITHALQDGRLSDFFALARSVLTTYNAGSAYVELADWDGHRCEDCGDGCSSDNTCWCEFCEHDYCEECIRCCTDCHCSGCRGCLERCAFTDEWVCRRCVRVCTECGDRGAGEHLEDGLCADCVKAAEAEAQAEADAEESEASDEPELSPTAHVEDTGGNAPCPCGDATAAHAA